MPRIRFCFLSSFFFFVGLLSACNYSVRQAGFYEARSRLYDLKPYRLVYICETETADAVAYIKQIRLYCEQTSPYINVMPQIVALDALDADARRELDAHFKTDFSELSVTAIERTERLMSVPIYMQRGKISTEMIDTVVRSPQRLALKTYLADPDNYCTGKACDF